MRNTKIKDFLEEMIIPTLDAELYYVAVRPAQDYLTAEDVYSNKTTAKEFPFIDLHDEEFALETVYTLCRKGDTEKEIKERLLKSLSQDLSVFGANYPEFRDRLAAAFGLSSEEVARYLLKNKDKYSLEQIEDHLLEAEKKMVKSN